MVNANPQKTWFQKNGSVFFMNKNTDLRKAGLLEALKKSRGIVSTACVCAGVARRTFYIWMDNDQDFRRSVEDINEESVDYVESKLMEKIDAGAERSIIFFLKTRGKGRGYRENGSHESNMLNRELAGILSSAYEGKSTRFDPLTKRTPEEIDALFDELNREGQLEDGVPIPQFVD